MTHQRHRRADIQKKTRTSRPEILELLLYYILPFIAVNAIILFLVTAKPQYELVVMPSDDYRTTTATFTIKSHLPLKNVTITFNEEPLDLIKVGNKSYQATITRNGILDVFMQNFNGMSVSNFEVIDSLDDEAPSIASYDMQEGQLSIVLNDSLSGIDYDKLHGTTPDGTVVAPLSVDRTNHTVIFPITDAGLTVSIKDLSGNEYLPNFSVVKTEAGSTEAETQLLVQ